MRTPSLQVGLAAILAATLTLRTAPVAAQPLRIFVSAPLAVETLVRARLAPLGNFAADELELRRRVAQAIAESREVLESLGYYAAKVDAGVEEDNGSWIVRFNVTTGEQTRVCMLDLRFTGPIQTDNHPEQSVGRLKAMWTLPESQPFRHAEWEAAKTLLQRNAAERVFAGARIRESRAEIDPATNCANLTVVLDSGPPVRFGALNVSGLSRYDRLIVENLNAADLGNVFDQGALQRFQLALQQSGYFSSVNVSALPDPTNPAVAPVIVRLEEQRLKALGFGAGYSTNTGYRGQVDYVQNSIFGTAMKLTTALKLEELSQSARADLTWPREANGWQWSVGARVERKDVQDVITRSYSSWGRRNKSSGDIDRQWNLTYITSDQTVAGGNPVIDRALALNHTWTIRRLKPAVFPDSGYALSVQLGGATRAALSEQDFVRTHAKVVKLIPVDGKTFLTLRGEAGLVASRSRSGIPLDFLFRTGGSASVRGYGYESLGVREGTAVLGGRYLAVGSAELTRWISGNWGGAVFVDAGGASDNARDYKASVGYGAGARLRTPVGPLSLDLAFAEQTQTLRLHFNLSIPF